MTSVLTTKGRLLLALLLVTTAPGPLHAQSGEERPPVAQPLRDGVDVRIRPSRPDTARGVVDESALRFWAARGDREKVEQEIDRLRARHPDWEPPGDLFGPVSAVDERPLWELYEAGDYDAVRAEIARLEDEHEDWSPPARLLELMEANEVRAELTRLEEAARWARLVEAARAHPRQIDCDAIDNMWRLARARVELGEPEAAYDLYARIIETCESVDNRIATLQKAKARLGSESAGRLFAIEAGREKSEDEAHRIADVERELRAPPPLPAVVQRIHRESAGLEDAARAEAEVRARRDPAAAERLGWIYLEAGENDQAAAWFERAMDWEPSAKRAEGLARAEARLGDRQRLEALAADWPDAVGPLLGDLGRERLARAFEAGDHAAVLALTETPDGAVARNFRAWTYLRLERPTEAAEAFGRVLDDDASLPSERREAAFGLANARLAIGNIEQALTVASAYRLPRAQHDELHAEALRRRALAAFEAEEHLTAVRHLEERRMYAEPNRDLLMLEAWTRYHLGQRTVARQMFEGLHRIYATEATAEGLAVVSRSVNGY